MIDDESFSALLKQFRLEAGLTQEVLAERAYVSSKSIGSLERDRSRLPRLETVRMLADALELDGPRRARFLSAARPIQSGAPGSIAFPGTLHVPSTPLYGRDRDLDLVYRLLADARDGTGPRLIVVTGPGGVGKTRLALAAAHRCAESLPIVTASVDLSPVEDEGMVLESIARQLGADDRERIPARDRIMALLRQRATMILLDNVEHLMGVRDELLSLLDDCPELILLVTSRVPLGVRAERQVRLEPLDVPSPESSVAEIVQSPAVKLFIDRARAAGWDADFAHDLSAVAALCRRLDGLPLAIELAAAWLNLYSPDELLHRLEQRLPLLTLGRSDMPARHQTMRAAIGWSYDLLEPDLQASFRRVCIFENGALLSTVRELRAGTVGELGVERHLVELTGQSLIGWRRDSGEAESSLHILDTIREFGRDHLRELGDYATVARLHADVMLSLAERLEPEIGGPNEQRALRRFDEEYDNFHAALSAAVADADRDRALRLAAALWRFWALRGVLAEGTSRLRAVISSVEDDSQVPASAWIGALTGAAILSMDFGELDRAAEYVDRALMAVQRSPNAPGQAGVRYAVGLLAAQRGELGQAETFVREALELARLEPDNRIQAAALSELSGIALRTGDRSRAENFERERLERCRRLGDRRGVAQSVKNLTFSAMFAGQFDEAQRLGEETTAELRSLGDTGILAEVTWALGHMAYLRGDLDRAAELLTESRSLRLARGDERNAAKSGGALAVVEIGLGHYDRARSLVEAADRPLREQQDRYGLAMNSLVRGHLEIQARNWRAADALLREGGGLLLEMDDLLYLPWCLEGLAVLAAQTADWNQSAELIGAHDGMSAGRGSVIPPMQPAAFREARAATLDALGTAAFDRATSDGTLDPVARAREWLR